MATLDNVKLILGIDSSDTSEDDLLNLYIAKAYDYVIDYCNLDEDKLENDDITKINSISEEIVVYKYQNRGTENLKSETLGSHSVSFKDELPDAITRQLNKIRRVKVV